MDIYNFVSLAGLFVLIAIGWALSADRRNVNWRVVAWGVGIQLLFGACIFVLPQVRDAFVGLNRLVDKLLGCTIEGTYFVFGRLALPPFTSRDGQESLGFFLMFQALPTIVFFSALMSILYYWRIMPMIVRAFARVFSRLMRVSGAEALCASSNIFVGIESALTIRPHLEKMTRSELCTVLTAGMATIASSVFAFYVFMLKGQFPFIAGHLMSASILSAPAALAMSKILLPERDHPETLGVDVQCSYEREGSLFEAIINGANAGMKLIFGIVALLLAVLSLVALVDVFLGAAGWRLNAHLGWTMNWSLKGLLGYVFYPLTLIIGVPWQDAGAISKIIGERTVVTEMVAYQDLAKLLGTDVLMFKARSAILATYALCGFAHLASMAIFVGGTAALVPSRSGDLTRVAVRALVAATLACLMTACIAGTFLLHGDNSILLGSVSP